MVLASRLVRRIRLCGCRMQQRDSHWVSPWRGTLQRFGQSRSHRMVLASRLVRGIRQCSCGMWRLDSHWVSPWRGTLNWFFQSRFRQMVLASHLVHTIRLSVCGVQLKCSYPPSPETQIPPHLRCIKAPHLPPKTATSRPTIVITTTPFSSRPAWNSPCVTPLTCLNPPLIIILIQPLSCCRPMDG
jgi:hypothetical protein